MKGALFTILLLALPMAQLALVVSAQQIQAAKVAAPKTGFRAEILRQIEDAEAKLLELGEAIPQEKYSWRPDEGVRSIREVYVHLAVANFSLPRALGVLPPAGIEAELEKVTDKMLLIKNLKESFAYVREVILDTPDAALEKAAKLYGKETTVRDILLALAIHAHEHLGQTVAYARINKIVPPWTATRESQMKQ